MTIQRPRRKYYYELAENGIIVLNDSGDDDNDHNANGDTDTDPNKKQRELQEEKQRIDILKERLYRLKKSTLDSSFCIHKIEEYDTTSSIIELLQKHLVTSENNYMKAIATATPTTTTGGGVGGGPSYGYVCNMNVEIVVNSSQIKKIDDTIMIIKKERRRRSLSSASSSTLLSSSLSSSECYQNL